MLMFHTFSDMIDVGQYFLVTYIVLSLDVVVYWPNKAVEFDNRDIARTLFSSVFCPIIIHI